MEAQTIAIWAAAIASASSIASPIVAVIIARKSSETALKTAELTARTAREMADADRDVERDRLRVERHQDQTREYMDHRRAVYLDVLAVMTDIDQALAKVDLTTLREMANGLRRHLPRMSLFGGEGAARILMQAYMTSTLLSLYHKEPDKKDDAQRLNVKLREELTELTERMRATLGVSPDVLSYTPQEATGGS